jgi:DNA polymerase-3 subunit alpha
VLGYYITANPIDQYKNLIQRARLTTSKTLPQARDRQSIQIAASISGFNRRMTKAGKSMMTIKADDSEGPIDAVVFGDSVGPIANVLQNESLVLLSGRAAVRDESVSFFVDSVQPLSQWIAGAAIKLTLDVSKQETLSDVKKILDGLKPGQTKVNINIHGADKTAVIALPRGVALSPTITTDLGSIGVRAIIE